jgi:hypothetical protein
MIEKMSAMKFLIMTISYISIGKEAGELRLIVGLPAYVF